MKDVNNTRNARETFEYARKLGMKSRPGEVYCLNGDLGVGKTVFAQGFADGVGVTDTVNSPTFTIVQVYDDGRIPLYHFDVYRIGDPEEMYEIGYDEYVSGDGVCLIEWADIIKDILPPAYISVLIEKDDPNDPDHRKISVESIGDSE